MRVVLALLILALVAWCLAVGACDAQAQCYGTNYSTASYSYNYSYYPSGWYQGRYFPAGHYAYVNGTWYRQGYGVEYGYYPGTFATAYITQAAPPPCAYPPQPQPTDLNKLAVELLARSLITSQTQQLTGQPGAMPAAAPQQAFPAYQQPPSPALTPEEVAKLKALLAGAK